MRHPLFETKLKRQLSPQAEAAIAEDAPPKLQAPRGFPRQSPYHRVTLFKPEKAKELGVASMTSTRLAEIRAKAEQHKLSGSVCVKMLLETCAEIDRLRRIVKRREGAKFSLADVMREAERMKWPDGLAEQCHDTYAATGWVYGKSRLALVDLAAAMRTWRRNHDKWNAPADGKPKLHFDIG